MSRSGYCDDYDDSDYPRALYRGTVASAMRGKRGQKLLRDMVAALDAMPAKRLISNDLVRDGDACALGVVGLARGVVGMDKMRLDDITSVAGQFDIADCMAREVVYINDEWWPPETPEERWARVRKWAAAHIKPST